MPKVSYEVDTIEIRSKLNTANVCERSVSNCDQTHRNSLCSTLRKTQDGREIKQLQKDKPEFTILCTEENKAPKAEFKSSWITRSNTREIWRVAVTVALWIKKVKINLNWKSIHGNFSCQVRMRSVGKMGLGGNLRCWIESFPEISFVDFENGVPTLDSL